jgi:hypothetical protein
MEHFGTHGKFDVVPAYVNVKRKIASRQHEHIIIDIRDKGVLCVQTDGDSLDSETPFRISCLQNQDVSRSLWLHSFIIGNVECIVAPDGIPLFIISSATIMLPTVRHHEWFRLRISNTDPSFSHDLDLNILGAGLGKLRAE